MTLTGARAWGPRTGPGTSASRTTPIDLAGMYTLAWRDHSELPGTRGRLRYLAVPVK